jgi:DNA-binding beta-propeller fold protein YncE
MARRTTRTTLTPQMSRRSAAIPRRVALRAAMAALVLATLAALVPVTAGAVGTGDQIYWGNETGAVRGGNLDGSGTAADVFAGATPCGVAIDPAAGKIYWASWFGNAIQVGNLDGSGPATTLFSESGNNLCGVAIDPAAGKIYWANFTSESIRVGNLDGSGTASTLFTEPVGSAPSGVAIDPAAGRIYWTNQFSDEVRVGNLNGSGTAATLFSGEDNPLGVAIDPAAGRIYWTDLVSCCSGPGQVRVGNLDGSGASTLFGDEAGPGGLAIDPAANKIYWAIFGPGAIRVGNLDGSGTASTLFSGESFSLFPALLKTPAGTTPPGISGAGGELTCSQGSWAPDLLGAFLYRAPQSFAYQWLLDGNEISGATATTYTPTAAGSYTCTVTASNHAGASSQTSAPWVIYHFSGFQWPVSNPPKINTWVARLQVPIRFGLGGNKGTGVVTGTTVTPINCTTRNPLGPASGASISKVTYFKGLRQYGFLWSTLRSWKGTCRMLTVSLNDGTAHTAHFRFK